MSIRQGFHPLLPLLLLAALLLWLAGCSPTSTAGDEPAADVAQVEEDDHAGEEAHGEEEHAGEDDHKDEGDDHGHEGEGEVEMLALPALAPLALDGRPLQVVATTSIVGDVVARVGGDGIELTTLMGPGQDPHSYEPAARDLTAVSAADLIFVNGWNLEEGLVDDLETIGGEVALVPISAGIEPLPFGGHEGEEHGEEEPEGEEHGEEEHGDEEHDHGSTDPHVWFSIPNVMIWVDNVAAVLSTLDPDQAELFAENAAAYKAELAELQDYAQEQLRAIPDENRYLVTNHDSFGYFAEAYDFSIIGTVIPGASTLSEPSASDLADLVTEMREYDICTIFTETTVSDSLAQTAAGELADCAAVQVLSLYTGAIGPAGSGADSYAGMMRTNIDTIVSGLR